MCGIAGRYSSRRLPPDPAWHADADRRLQHRGPDDHGYFADEHCELVHRRLSIIDLSPTGHQPMPNEDETVLVVFNGEIYNHRELRHELEQQGHRFRGSSDTEVLVHLYEQVGESLADRLSGMFAFAIYDRRKRRLVLARDRFGIKPLYYAETAEQIVFASEIKAIVAAAGVAPGLDRQACYDFLGLGYIPEPATGLTGLAVLAKGTTLVVDPDGRRLLEHGRIDRGPRTTAAAAELVDRVEAALAAAVERQRMADVPVAALLSGGIDSSLVVAALCRTSRTPPLTFNVAFPDAQYDETAVAMSVARHYGTKHETIRLDERALAPETAIELLRHFDQPFADTSLFPVYWVAKAIRDRGIVCTLSGDGGDEAFGGYASFWRIEKLFRLMQVPRPLQRVLEAAGRATAPMTRDLGRQLAKATGLAHAMRSDSRHLLAGLSNYLDEAQKQELVRADARAGLATIEHRYREYDPRGISDLEELSARLTENYFALGLPGDMLRKVDMMSMKASIEVRVPMLDEQLVQLGLALGHAMKTDGKRGKLVLRMLADRWLPADVAAHPKQGFGIPLDRMVSSRFHDMLADHLLAADARTRGVLERAVIEDWLRLFRAAGRGHAGGRISRGGLYQRIIIVFALELFLRERSLSW